MNHQNPVCIHYGICGGCSYPHDSYFSKEIYEKQSDLLELFKPLLEHAQVQPIIPCEVSTCFRNKMEFSFTDTLSGERNLGLMTLGKSRQALNLETCYLIDPVAIQCLKITKEWWNKFPEIRTYYSPKNKGSLCSLTIRLSRAKKELMVVLTTSGRKEYALDQDVVLSLVNALKIEIPITSFIWKEKHAQKGHPTFYETTCLYGKDNITMLILSPNEKSQKPFIVKSDSFFQPNDFQITNIFKTILNLSEFSGSETLLDLFCGSGIIGIMLSPFVKEVIGVEINQDAVASAHLNLKLNAINSVKIIQNDVKQFVKSLSLDHSLDHFQQKVIVLDPPRCGLQAKIIKYLLRINAEKIIYVSCNPKTQFADCSELISHGYQITAMQPIDQFPYTRHLENVVLLKKTS